MNATEETDVVEFNHPSAFDVLIAGPTVWNGWFIHTKCGLLWNGVDWQECGDPMRFFGNGGFIEAFKVSRTTREKLEQYKARLKACGRMQ